jgi:imidazolonepropionase-like amidohydrolase
MTRREFLVASASVLAAGAQEAPRRAVRPVPRVVPGRPVLLKGGTVLSLDPKVGDFDAADVLINGSKVSAVGPNLNDVPANVVVIDAIQSIVMP